MKKSKEMVFSWGCNHNNQLGMIHFGQDQPDCMYEPTLVEDLLQFTHIRKIKCVADRTMVLVDSPNTLLIYSKRDNIREK
jgi:hypothetical protein